MLRTTFVMTERVAECHAMNLDNPTAAVACGYVIPSLAGARPHTQTRDGHHPPHPVPM